MEAMEVDSPVELQGIGQPEGGVATPAGDAENANAALVMSDSGSSTEVDDDDDDDDGSAEGQAAAYTPPRLPATWAFSQRAVGGATSTPPIRRRVR